MNERSTRAVIGLLAVSLLGCAVRRDSVRRDPCLGAIARRDQVRDGQLASGVGIGVGAIASIVGFMLAARGAEIRGMESSADTEGGIGELLGGTLLAGAGVSITLGSGIGLGVYSARRRDADAGVARTCAR